VAADPVELGSGTGDRLPFAGPPTVDTRRRVIDGDRGPWTDRTRGVCLAVGDGSLGGTIGSDCLRDGRMAGRTDLLRSAVGHGVGPVPMR